MKEFPCEFYVQSPSPPPAGCSSAAQRMSDCQAQGVSRDACHTAEQNRQAAVKAAVEQQAMENARDLKLNTPVTKGLDQSIGD
ncbi:hypothetical protein [Pseudomonas sp. KCJK8993]|uniref:hypothetical protein n=1 Tax=Pseudomonas sp. KCJK8993 TaxID=3344565 RepID=UPI003906399A